jgi:hydroxymethylglutaryl-CoA reductase
MSQENKSVEGFSKWPKEKKRLFLEESLKSNQLPADVVQLLAASEYPLPEVQQIFEQFSENTIGNFHMPFGVIPEMLMNEQNFTVPMVIEESSVVAACGRAAKFWNKRGGVHAEVLGVSKVGQIHLYWQGATETLQKLFLQCRQQLLDDSLLLTESMQARGGGVLSFDLLDKTKLDRGYFQIFATFDTCDAMGANFINSLLEHWSRHFKEKVDQQYPGQLEVVMSILSNYTPECRVKVSVSCPVTELSDHRLELAPAEFAAKMVRAAKIARMDPYRAATHNKGIFNGVDAVCLATGNDFRAIEACGHSYAARDGQYRGLTSAEVTDEGIFIFSLELPLALGTVGGLTILHPLARLSLDLLGRPSAQELMMLAASVGLLQNFAALRSLVTSGIQKGHMKMHLMNILRRFEATEEEIEAAKKYFTDKVVTNAAVRSFLTSSR